MRRRYNYGDQPWHPWFAWRPVVADDHYVWLEVIWRRVNNCQGYLCSRYSLERPE